MHITMLSVEGMSCDHCVKAVKDAVSALPGVHGVMVDLSAKTATVEHDPVEAPATKIIAAIEDQGYEAKVE